MRYVQGNADRKKQNENPKTIENRRPFQVYAKTQIIQKHLY
jgi:hypothetical protein